MSLRGRAALVIATAGLGACVDGDGPRIDSVSPAAAPRGATVELVGGGFCRRACERTAGSVAFGLEIPMVRAMVTGWTTTRITAVVPSAAPVGPTDVIVTVDGQSSNAIPFEVQ